MTSAKRCVGPRARPSPAAHEPLRYAPPGVWRSLVARSVRVGEVPSSNLGTPMGVGEPVVPLTPPPWPAQADRVEDALAARRDRSDPIRSAQAILAAVR